MARERLPKRLCEGDIVLIKITQKGDDNTLVKLLGLYKNNTEHLLYWHHGWDELLFALAHLRTHKHIQKNNLITSISLIFYI
jgi:hypothetical protein